MLIGKSLRNPNNSYRVQTCGIGQQLPKMRMVRALKLVLD